MLGKRSSLIEEREKKNKKNHLHINSNRVYMHDYCSFTQPWCIFAYFHTD